MSGRTKVPEWALERHTPKRPTKPMNFHTLGDRMIRCSVCGVPRPQLGGSRSKTGKFTCSTCKEFFENAKRQTNAMAHSPSDQRTGQTDHNTSEVVRRLLADLD